MEKLHNLSQVTQLVKIIIRLHFCPLKGSEPGRERKSFIYWGQG